MEAQDIIKIVKFKISKELDNEILCIAINEAESTIKSYCNIKNIPEGLKFTLVNMSIDIIETQYITDKEENIKSIQQGDTTISFADKHKEITKESIIQIYRKELNSYRRLRK